MRLAEKLAESMIDTGHGIRIASGANANIGVEIEDGPETLDGVGAETKTAYEPAVGSGAGDVPKPKLLLGP